MLAHWNNSPRIDMSPHLDTLSWFRVNKYLLFLLNGACLAEKPWSTVFETNTLYITLSLRLYIEMKKLRACRTMTNWYSNALKSPPIGILMLKMYDPIVLWKPRKSTKFSFTSAYTSIYMKRPYVHIFKTTCSCNRTISDADTGFGVMGRAIYVMGLGQPRTQRIQCRALVGGSGGKVAPKLWWFEELQ